MFEQSYPPNTTDFSAILPQCGAAPAPMRWFICSYPPDSSAIIRGLSEVGIGDSVKLFGAPCWPAICRQPPALWPSLNGIVNFNLFVPSPPW